MRHFDELIVRLCQYFTENKINYVIIGGVAILFQGRFRTTEDIDIIIDHEKLDIKEFVSFCKGLSLSVEEYDLTEGFEQLSHVSILDIPNNLRVDLKGAYRTIDRDLLANFDSFEYNDILIKVAIPEFLITNKLYKGGQIDIEDAISVFIQSEERINHSLMKKMADQLGVADHLEKFISKIEELKLKYGK